VPAYEEVRTIGALLEELDARFSAETVVRVLNDRGDDDTGAVVRGFSPDTITIDIMEREGRQGLGSAYRAAIPDCDTDHVGYMDADLSHRPRDMERMYERVRTSGCDLVIGSRFVRGGERRDPLHRRLPPLIGSWLYQHIAGFPVADVTSGIRVFDRSVIDTIDWDALPADYSFQTGFTAAALRSGIAICEEPIVFKQREAGRSKYHLGHLISNVELLMDVLLGRSPVDR